jgi:hypothetical protein
MKKRVSVWLDDEIWQRFKDYCMEKHGKLHSVMGEELASAIALLIGGVHTHVGQQNASNHDGKEKTDRSIYTELPAVVEAIAKNYEVGAHISRAALARVINRCCGVFDRRAVEARINALIAYGVLDRYRATGSGGVLDKVANHMYTVKSHGLSIGPGGGG